MHNALPMLWLLLPLLSHIGNRCRSRRANGCLLLIGTIVVGYFLLLVSVWAIDANLERELYRFDIDGNGSFSDAEMTPAAERAMEEFTNDTGRVMAPVFGLPYTAVWYCLCFAILSSAERITKLLVGKPKEKCETLQNLQYPEPDGNPYQPPTLNHERPN